MREVKHINEYFANPISIKSLNDETKKKIKQLMLRCQKLDHGVTETVTFTFPIKVQVDWQGGEEARPVDNGSFEDLNNKAQKLLEKSEKNLVKKINKEIKEIIAFANKTADKLKVDRDDFWMQYFAFGGHVKGTKPF